MEQAVEGIEAVYHLGAAFQGGGPFTDDEFFEINVRGTFNMLEAARRVKGMGQFLFASSDALYDKYVPGGMSVPIDEQTPRVLKGAYALTKALGEELCNGYWQGYQVPTTILRFAMVWAADEMLQFPQFYLSKMKEVHPELADPVAGRGVRGAAKRPARSSLQKAHRRCARHRAWLPLHLG